MNNRMRHFIVKLLCDEMGCKDISEIAGFAFYRNGQNEPVFPDEPVPIMPEPVDGADGYVYDGMVLPKPTWNKEKYPYAIMCFVDDAVKLYASNVPLGYRARDAGLMLYYATISAPYCVATYDRATNTWAGFAETAEGDDVQVYSSYLMWSNQTIAGDGNVVIEGTTPRAFYLNDPNTPTAFLSTGGRIEFKSSSTPSTDFVAAYVGWETAKYITTSKVPWLRIDKERIGGVTINADAIPAHTDYWFYECEDLRSMSLSEGLTKIGNYMFYGTTIYPLSFPSTIEEIGNYACANLKSYGITTNLRQSIVIPDSCKKIGTKAFYSACLDYSSGATIGSGCVEIGGYAFAENPTLKRVTIGASVRRIHPYAFYQCGKNRTAVNAYDDTYCRFTFKNTNGWWVNTNANATEGTAVDVSDVVTNAKMLAGYSYGSIWGVGYVEWHAGTYVNYYWNRSESSSDPDEPVVPDEPDIPVDPDAEWETMYENASLQVKESSSAPYYSNSGSLISSTEPLFTEDTQVRLTVNGVATVLPLSIVEYSNDGTVFSYHAGNPHLKNAENADTGYDYYLRGQYNLFASGYVLYFYSRNAGPFNVKIEKIAEQKE